MSENIDDLFNEAHEMGDLSEESISALQVEDIGQEIERGMGIPAFKVNSSEVIIVGMLLDDSGSIRMGGNSDAIREGHNGCLEAVKGASEGQGTLWYSRYLSGTVLNPFCLVQDAQEMTPQNYNPIHDTPLYRATTAFLGAMMAKYLELASRGIQVRTISLIMTDGGDTTGLRPDMCSPIVADMFRTEMHMLFALGLDDKVTNFNDVFSKMGYPSGSIWTPKRSGMDDDQWKREIRRHFNMFSQRAEAVSQHVEAFDNAAGGGFAISASALQGDSSDCMG